MKESLEKVINMKGSKLIKRIGKFWFWTVVVIVALITMAIIGFYF